MSTVMFNHKFRKCVFAWRVTIKSVQTKLALYALGSVLAVISSTVAAEDLNSSKFSKMPHDKVVFLEQGWDDEKRAVFYQTTQGSRMLPYDWFLKLEQANRREKLSSASNIRKMGFLVDGRSDANPDGLPVGFAKDVDPIKGDSIGLTCAACHTGQLERHGTKVRIDGGQSMGDIEQLQNGIFASLAATLEDDKKFGRFSDRVIGRLASDDARNKLFTGIEYYRDWWKARIERSKGITPHGPSRTDAFTIIANEVTCRFLAIPENCPPANAVAPNQFPFLWDTPDFEWVQYNSSVHNPLGRNVGEVTGVYAEMKFSGGSIISSANINNLYDLEELLKELHAPAWPEELFGKIDTGLAEQGEPIFADKCSGCHAEHPDRTAPNAFGKTFAKVNFDTPLCVLNTDPSSCVVDLNTDPTAASSFATRRAFPGVFLPVAVARGVIPDLEGKVPVAELLNISGSAIISKFFTNPNSVLLRSPIEYLGFRESLSPSVAQLTTYKARPLNGVAFTAPYLHNGSVASMYELLLPEDQRLAKFYVGSKRFDPIQLGFSTKRERNPNTVLLDTTAKGNGNSGHEFGTDLSHDDRMAVIEYIKTLK
jgi:hypothetical protein